MIRTDEHGDGLERLLLVLVVVQVQLHHDFLHTRMAMAAHSELVIRLLWRLRTDEGNAMHRDGDKGRLTFAFDMSRRGGSAARRRRREDEQGVCRAAREAKGIREWEAQGGTK